MKRSILDRVRVVSPCGESWNEMRGNGEVRFCSHCAKGVHNLSEMTRRDAERLVAKSKGRLCVRYATRADRNIHTASDFPSLHKITRRVSRIAAGAFTATLAITSAAAQTSIARDESEAVARAVINKGDSPRIGSGKALLVGTVSDVNEAVIPQASVTLTDAATGSKLVTQTDEEGCYRFYNLPVGTYSLEIVATGFARFDIEKLLVLEGKERRVNATLDVGTMGEIIIVSPAGVLVRHDDKRTVESEDDNMIATASNESTENFLDAAGNHDADELKPLLLGGANVNVANEWNETALMLGAGDKATVKLLLKSKADVHARSKFGVTPLMYAALNEDASVTRMLVKAGAEVDARDMETRTALMFAALDGNVETVKSLLAAGADVNARDKSGKSVFEFGIESDRIEVVNALRAAGAGE
jgi:hypothetical protein